MKAREGVRCPECHGKDITWMSKMAVSWYYCEDCSSTWRCRGLDGGLNHERKVEISDKIWQEDPNYMGVTAPVNNEIRSGLILVFAMLCVGFLAGLAVGVWLL